MYMYAQTKEKDQLVKHVNRLGKKQSLFARLLHVKTLIKNSHFDTNLSIHYSLVFFGRGQKKLVCH